MASLIAHCNAALSEIAAGQIVTLNEASVEAEQCSIHYPAVLVEMAEWADWQFNEAWAALAATTNDRASDWEHAFALPTDFSRPLYLGNSEDAAADGLPTWGPFSQPWQRRFPLHYAVAGNLIYSNTVAPILVYQRNTLTVDQLPPMLGRAFQLELASRLAWPVKKDRTLKGDLIKQAELAKARAIAEEENKNPRHDADYVSMAEYARSDG